MATKGSSMFGPDVVVGSAEYAKLWREKNKGKHELAQAKYRARQRELALAARVAKEDGIPVQQALAEVRGRLEAITQVRKDYKEEGVLSGKLDTGFLIPAEGDSLNPFIVEYAARIGVSYRIAEKVMYDYDDSSVWEAKMIEMHQEEISKEVREEILP